MDNTTGLVPDEAPFIPNLPEDCKNNDNVLCRLYNTSTLINITDLIGVSVAWEPEFSVTVAECETNCTVYEFKLMCCEFPCVTPTFEIPTPSSTEPPSSRNYTSPYNYVCVLQIQCILKLNDPEVNFTWDSILIK